MTIEQKARILRQVIENLAENNLDDTSALENSELFPNWAPNTTYEVGFRIRYQDILYKCLQTHSSISGWEPINAVSLWAKVLIPDPEIISDWEQPDSTNPYMKGDKVRHLERIWISDIDNNVWEPSVYGWSEVSA